MKELATNVAKHIPDAKFKSSGIKAKMYYLVTRQIMF